MTTTATPTTPTAELTSEEERFLDIVRTKIGPAQARKLSRYFAESGPRYVTPRLRKALRSTNEVVYSAALARLLCAGATARKVREAAAKADPDNRPEVGAKSLKISAIVASQRRASELRPNGNRRPKAPKRRPTGGYNDPLRRVKAATAKPTAPPPRPDELGRPNSQ